MFAMIAFGQVLIAVGGGQALTNQDVIGMVSFGLSDDVLLGKIRASQSADFGTNVNIPRQSRGLYVVSRSKRLERGR